MGQPIKAAALLACLIAIIVPILLSAFNAMLIMSSIMSPVVVRLIALTLLIAAPVTTQQLLVAYPVQLDIMYKMIVVYLIAGMELKQYKKVVMIVTL